VDGDENTSSAPLLFRGRLTEADVVEIRRCHDLVLIRRSIRWLARGFAILLAGLLVWFMVEKGPNVISVVVLTVCLYLLFVLPYERAWSARRHYRRHAADYLETEVRLTPDRVSIANDAYRAEFVWRRLGGLAEARSGILFYDQAYQAVVWLPARLLEGNELRAQVLALATGNGVRVSRV
jgi:hypothetical protein